MGDVTVSPTYQHIVVRGLPYDRGFQHGAQARDKVRTNVEYYSQPGKLPDKADIGEIITRFYIPGLEKYFPAALAEMQGIAAGAEVELFDIVMLNARYDLSRFKADSPASELPASDECTSSIFLSSTTTDNSVITAQNWDMSSHLYVADTIIYLEIHPDPAENIPPMFLVTEAGQLCRSGMNAAGLGLTANSLQSTWDFNPLGRYCLPVVPPVSVPLVPASLVRRLFLHQSNFATGLTTIERCPVHVSSNIMVATAGDFGFSLEITPQRIYRIPASPASSEGYLLHANHFTHPAFLQQHRDVVDQYRGNGSSWFRADRLEYAVKALAATGALDERSITNAFKDHMSFPFSLCAHSAKATEGSTKFSKDPYSGENCTVACIAYNLTKRTIRVCKGPPCNGVFETFELKA
ncbi:peptidase C45 acyl-coenzyme A:6-aminopenicillanic acid acyl-transferase [Mycena floridula]|nr:peptidase C45 acyl-coenzyme A:6-aminopenicillanic acid acyl-transferase [Mycena floridula]